jgi:predicted RNA-binding protein
MTATEMIAELLKFPGDTPVLRIGHDGELVEVTDVMGDRHDTEGATDESLPPDYILVG